MLVGWFAAAALAAWLGVLLLPSRPWRVRERLDAPAPAADAGDKDLSRVTVLIPARNEATSIGATLRALATQGDGLRVLIIDDESEDDTAGVAAAVGAELKPGIISELVSGEPLPAGWGGKLWALEQGLARVDREYCLLLDAEISLAPGMLPVLLDKARRENRAMVSIMARLRCSSFWERLLVPPFIFFFKLLYPFARVNDERKSTAAAAGGCILIATAALRNLGGFAAMRDALIDDCTLAARVKRGGHSVWLGLSQSVTSTRAYPDLASFRQMVTRTAFTQLAYSNVLLLAVCALMLIMFVAPWAAMLWGEGIPVRLAGLAAVIAMALAYWPTVSFYGLRPYWTLTLVPAALLFLGMTVESAWKYWLGVRAEWKGRRYATH